MINVPNNSILRFNGSYKLEEYGWKIIEESDSDLINTTIMGRETQSYSWLKSENLISSVNSGMYRLSTNEITDNNKYIRTEFFESLKDFSYTLKIKLSNFDIDYYNAFKRQENSFDIYGINLINIKNKYLSIQVSLGKKDGQYALILISNGIVKDYIFFNWNVSNISEYRIKVTDEFIYIFNGQNMLFQDFSSNYKNEGEDKTFISFDFETNISQEDYINETIIDFDLIQFEGLEEQKKSSLESNDFFLVNGNKVTFKFKNKQPLVDGYDGYDGYDTRLPNDQFIMIADSKKFVSDVFHPSGDRLSIYFDGRGFLNFRIISGEEVYKVSSNIKNFRENEIHHIAASWSVGNVNGDELKLFLDGKEAKNLIRFGSNVTEIFTDKFSDTEKERLQHFSKRIIDYSDTYNASSSVATNSITLSGITLDNKYLGKGIIIEEATTYASIVGKYYMINEINGNSIKIVDPINFNQITISASDPNIKIKFAPSTSFNYYIKTDIDNSKFTINKNNDELGIMIYKVENSKIILLDKDPDKEIEARVNLSNRTIEFVRRNSICSYEPSILITDRDIFISSYGLKTININRKVEVSASTVLSSEYSAFNQKISSIKTDLDKPISLDSVSIINIVQDRFIPIVTLKQNNVKYYKVSFYESVSGYLSSQKINEPKVNSGRKVSLVFDSDNFYHDESLGSIVSENKIIIKGQTIDGSNYEEFLVTRNGKFDGTKLFTKITSIEGELNIIDLNEESCVLQILETDSIFVPNGSGDHAKLFDYSNGEFFIGKSASEIYDPYELPSSIYLFQYSKKLKIKSFELGERLHIGTDYKKRNHAKSYLEEFKVFSEKFEDKRAKNTNISQYRNIDSEYLAPKALGADKSTFSLLPLNNPFQDQIRKLKRTKFLDRINNITYYLDEDQIYKLSKYLNDEANFIFTIMQFGIDFDKAKKTYYEVHKANKGPIKNLSLFYPNDSYVYRFNSTGPNNNFSGSAKFDMGYNIKILNDNVAIDPNGGAIEFWVSPMLDTLNDKEERVYFDSRDIVEEFVVPLNSRDIKVSSPIRKILSITLLKKDEVGNLKTIYDELEVDQISGLLNKGTGVLSDFKLNYKMISDKTIRLLNGVLDLDSTVKVRYTSRLSSGDFIKISKDKFSNICLDLQTNKNKKSYKFSVRWKDNSWHKIKFYFNKRNKRVYFFIDGINVIQNTVYNVDFKDLLNTISIGGFSNKSCFSRISNFRITRGELSFEKNISGKLTDRSYSSELSLNNPVLKDDLTTLFVNFDDNLSLDYSIASVIDPKNGIFSFDVEVDDSFDLLTDDLKDLIDELVNALKPAHTNVEVEISKKR